MIVDRKQFDAFINILPDLKQDEVYFFSLSARNKYLTAEERQEYALGRTEMFSREIARDKEGIYYVMNKLKASLQYRKTNNGKTIPEKALVIYANINPSSTIKAYQLFKQEIDKQVNDVINTFLNSKEPNFEGLTRINRELMNCIQKARSRKYYIDLDIDLYNKGTNKCVDDLTSFLKENKSVFYKIETFSGYHFLVKKETVPNNLFSKMNEYRLSMYIKEIEFNKNEMIPVPGTLQAGKLVKFVE
jgi:hypothetical protein